MQYKFVYFGNAADAESRMLTFIDANWDRVISAGFSANLEADPFEVPGWYCRLAKAAVAPVMAKVSAKRSAQT